MPNWVKGRITIEGNNSEKIIKEITKEVTDEDDGTVYRVLDFNTIIPMPESLKVISGSLTDECVDIYLNSLEQTEKNKVVNMLKTKSKDYDSISSYGQKTKQETDKLIKEVLTNYNTTKSFFDVKFNNLEDILNYGKQICDNVEKYGYKDWYYWSIANWGTKWNACRTNIKDNIIDFETAWSDVRKLVNELSNKYPENEFNYLFSMEQIGTYCGEYIVKAGKVISNIDFDDESKIAWETAFDLWCIDPDYFHYDEEKSTYQYVGNEEAEKIYREKERKQESEQT